MITCNSHLYEVTDTWKKLGYDSIRLFIIVDYCGDCFYSIYTFYMNLHLDKNYHSFIDFSLNSECNLYVFIFNANNC